MKNELAQTAGQRHYKIFSEIETTMELDLSKLIFCELDISYDREAFIREIDTVLLPDSTQIDSTSRNGVEEYAPINQQWAMIPESEYLQENSKQAWFVNSLIYYDAEDRSLKRGSEFGSVLVRNRAIVDAGRGGSWRWKKKYENLALTQFIKSLPLTDIVHARLLYLPANHMVAIHRDNRNAGAEYKLSKNLLSDSGYVSITLNISNGGSPLFFSASEGAPAHKISDAMTFIFNDYFLHGVPRVDSPRRQFRISGKPAPELFEKIKESSVLYE